MFQVITCLNIFQNNEFRGVKIHSERKSTKKGLKKKFRFTNRRMFETFPTRKKVLLKRLSHQLIFAWKL
jgi:hypothetical protein